MLQPPAPSPRHPEPSKSPTGELSIDDIQREVKASKKQSRRRPWYYGLGALLATGGLGTGGVAWSKGETQGERLVRIETKAAALEQKVDRSVADAGAVSDRLRSVERKVDKMRGEQRIVNQLLLERLGVPKSKQPKQDDDE